jgi:hypothetical protein
VKTKTYFAFRVDVWDGAGDNIVEHVAGVDDFETAVASSTVMPSIEQMREHLAQAERHIAELQRQIDRQRQFVDGLPLESRVREDAVQMLTMLEDSLPILEQHRELIRSWLERSDQAAFAQAQRVHTGSPLGGAGCRIHSCGRSRAGPPRCRGVIGTLPANQP